MAFINKMDRTGADPDFKVSEQFTREKLGCDAVMMQLPIGSAKTSSRVSIDLLARRKLSISTAPNSARNVRRESDVPPESDAVAKRPKPVSHLLEALAMYSDELMELLVGRGRSTPRS